MVFVVGEREFVCPAKGEIVGDAELTAEPHGDDIFAFAAGEVRDIYPAEGQRRETLVERVIAVISSTGLNFSKR